MFHCRFIMSDNASYDLLLQSISKINNSFVGSENTSELLSIVEYVFPMSSNDYKVIDVKGTKEKFKTSIKCNLKNEEDVKSFIADYMTLQ